MATKLRLKRLKKDVIKLFGIMEMKAFIVKERPTLESLDTYYIAADNLSEKLDDYYASLIMYLQQNNEELFDYYMLINKERAKKKILLGLVKPKQEAACNNLNVSRIKRLQQTVKETKNPAKKEALKIKLNRLEAWAKDINY